MLTDSRLRGCKINQVVHCKIADIFSLTQLQATREDGACLISLRKMHENWPYMPEFSYCSHDNSSHSPEGTIPRKQNNVRNSTVGMVCQQEWYLVLRLWRSGLEKSFLGCRSVHGLPQRSDAFLHCLTTTHSSNVKFCQSL